MKMIRNSIILLNVTLTLIAISICIVKILYRGLVFDYLLFLIVTFALVGSVLHMRLTIKRTSFILPNDSLVCTHLIIFTAWFISEASHYTLAHFYQKLNEELMKIDDHSSEQYKEEYLKYLRLAYAKSILELGDMVIASIGNIFLSYMALRFARAKKGTETDDPILGRKVPSIVYL